MKKETKIIGDKILTIVLLGCVDGLAISQKLGATVLPIYAKAVNEKNIDMVLCASQLLVALPELNLTDLINKLFKNATVNDFPLTPDSYFSGNYGELIDFLAFALEANFKSFFKASLLSNQFLNTTLK